MLRYFKYAFPDIAVKALVIGDTITHTNLLIYLLLLCGFCLLVVIIWGAYREAYFLKRFGEVTNSLIDIPLSLNILSQILKEVAEANKKHYSDSEKRRDKLEIEIRKCQDLINELERRTVDMIRDMDRKGLATFYNKIDGERIQTNQGQIKK